MADKKWKASDVTDAKHLGPVEFWNKGEWQTFELLETPDRIVFGGACNAGFIESGYIEKDGNSTDETLAELLADLEVYYNDGRAFVSRIVCNERM